MTKEWIPAIYDRTYGNVQDVEFNPDQENPKGCWNAVDLNRIENNVQYVAEYMYERRIVHSPIDISPPEFEEWTDDMIPTAIEINRILNNVRLLVELSRNNPSVADQIPMIYAATQINYILANNVEWALEIMHTQPRPPLDYFEITLTNGIIVSILRADGTTEMIGNSTALAAEDEVVTIMGTEYGEYAQYQTFTYWSGTPEDIGLLNNYQSQSTYFTMPYRAVTLTANFETHIPRTLTLTNGYISPNKDPRAETGPRSGTYLAGDEIMIIADIAPSGKEFYEWEGTEEALDHITGVTMSEDPSTALLTMPDCNVQLQPHYINAGRHYVTVTNGTTGGEHSKLYSYNENVSIAASVPAHYGFDYWSGDTSYLSDIYSSYQSFKMKDYNINFTAHYSYRPSTNSVEIINGFIVLNNQNVTQGTTREGDSYTLVPTPPDASQGIDYWEIEGAGSASTTTFYAGDGNAILTAHYAPIRTLTVNNINNGGGTTNYTAVQGHNWTTVTTNSKVGDYRFKRWEENGTQISTSTSITLTAGANDRVITAVYEYEEPPIYYTLTQINKNNGGSTTSNQYQQGSYVTVSTTEYINNQILEGIYLNNSKVTSSTSYSFYMNTNNTVEFRYRNRENYTLTVQNGVITSTGQTSGTFLERTSVGVTANSPSAGATFTGWRTVSGSLYSSPSGISGTAVIGRSDATIQAQYSNLRNITVITNSGTTTQTIVEGNYLSINAGTAPATYEFNHWEITVGDGTVANVYQSSTRITAHSQDTTVQAVYTPIPWFTVTMVDGYIWDGSDWVTSVTLLRNSTNAIKMKPAPTGHQFNQWEVYENGVLQTNANDVYEPVAEQTRLRNLLRDITIKATYFVPDPTVTYTLSIERKDGTMDQRDYPVGIDVDIRASYPDQGMEFYKWTGDTAYVGNIYNDVTYVRMPAQNIQIKENYVPEGYIPEFEVVMKPYGYCCYYTESEDPETHEPVVTPHWVQRHSFPEGTVVPIKAEGWGHEYRFNLWKAYERELDQDGQEITRIIDDTTSPTTSLTVPAMDVTVEPKIAQRDKRWVLVNGGGTNAQYYGGDRADVYFGLENTNDIHYQFIRWVTGANSEVEVRDIELYDGGMFSVTTPGSSTVPQYIKMPEPVKTIEVNATYKTLYRLSLTNGTIDGTSGSIKEYYESGSTVRITADPAPSGMRFQYWTGNVDVLSDRYDPTPIVTTVAGTTTLTAVYSTDAERNGTGYVTISLKNSQTVSDNDITVVSGSIDVGFIVTDSGGHIYTLTSIDAVQGNHTIYRLTKILRGGNIYG